MTKRIHDIIEREMFFNGFTPVTSTIQREDKLGFKRLTPDAFLPTKAHASDSGFDLYASEDVIIEPGATVIVPTGIAVVLPKGFEATVRPRSGVTAKTKLRVQLGTIDNGYSGAIGVIVDNIAQSNGIGSANVVKQIDGGCDFTGATTFPNDSYIIRKGDRIAQLVVTRLPQLEAVEVFDVEESARGDRGFGSSGVTGG